MEETLAALALAAAQQVVRVYTNAQAKLPASITSTDPTNPNVECTIAGVVLKDGQTVLVEESVQYDVTSSSGAAGRIAAVVGTVLSLTGNPDYDEVDDSIPMMGLESPFETLRSVTRSTFVSVGPGLGQIPAGTYTFTMGSYLLSHANGTAVHAEFGTLTLAVYK